MTELTDILPQLEQRLGPLAGEPVPLDGGITNRNFRVRLGEGEYVVRLHGAGTGLLGIDRESERAANAAAAALGIAPGVAASLGGALVTQAIDVRAPAPGEIAARAEELGGALRRFHDSGLQLPSTFWVPDLLAAYASELERRGAAPPPGFAGAAEAAGRIAAALPLAHPRPCHNDLLPGNILHPAGEDGVAIVDWEYAGMGHPYFDLGNLSVNNEFDRACDARLLAAYLGRPASPAESSALALMRVLSDAREAAWGMLQAHVSELEFDFAGYASKHFERLRAAVERPSFEEWLASAQA
ncbi:MAG TPA: phosphotransferase [Solirubrobacteraceae bacterium]|nr:phosphotransferase [Solirubrobacteraceae bacterium]